VLVALAALAAAALALILGFALLGGGDAHKPQRALSTTLANQQLAGLADPGPAAGPAAGTAAGTAQRLLAPAATGLSFAAGGGDGTVLASQQWQADQMTDGSYVLVYVPNGKCLDAAGGSPAAQGAAHPAARLALTTCDLRSSQRWQHPYLGKDPTGRDYWQLRSQATALCVTASGAQWRDGTAAQLEPCGRAFGWQQLIEFWSAY
jgi:hypothetical protein